MKIIINKEVFKKFSSKFKVTFLKIEHFDQKTRLKESVELLDEVSKLIKFTFHKDSLKTHHMISTWATAQEEFGKNAKHYHTSVEGLMKKVLTGKKVATKNIIENLVNYVSLKYIVPISVDDYQKIEGDLFFRIADGSEKSGLIFNVKKGALILCDQDKKNNLISTKLDFWKCKRTKVNKKSESILTHFDILPPISVKKSKEIIDELKRLIEGFTNAEVSELTLELNNNFGEI